MKRPPRVVLDTNVVVSALRYRGGLAARVLAGWEEGRFVPLASTDTARELVRVLNYPKFGLTSTEREELLSLYLPWVEVVHLPVPPPSVPDCRDVNDVPFLQLALAGRAQMIVSGDKDLLAVDGARGMCPVLRIADFCEQVLD